MLYVCLSQSTKTGMHPFWIIGFTVVGNPEATVITSSPFLILSTPYFSEVRDEKAIKFAEEPELTGTVCLIPRKFENFSSNKSVYLHYFQPLYQEIYLIVPHNHIWGCGIYLQLHIGYEF